MKDSKKNFWYEAIMIGLFSVWYIPYTRGWKIGLKAVLVLGLMTMNNMFMTFQYNIVPVTQDQWLMHIAFTVINVICIGIIGAYVLRNIPCVTRKFLPKFGTAFALSMITFVIIGSMSAIGTWYQIENSIYEPAYQQDIPIEENQHPADRTL